MQFPLFLLIFICSMKKPSVMPAKNRIQLLGKKNVQVRNCLRNSGKKCFKWK